MDNRKWREIWIPLVPVIALIGGTGIYWLANTTDTNKIFGRTVAEHSPSKR